MLVSNIIILLGLAVNVNCQIFNTVDYIASQSSLTTAYNLIIDFNLEDTLRNGEFTIFAPSDNAFANLDPEILNKFENNPQYQLSVLQLHVTPGFVDIPSLLNLANTGQPLVTLGDPLSVVFEQPNRLFLVAPNGMCFRCILLLYGCNILIDYLIQVKCILNIYNPNNIILIFRCSISSIY